MNEEVCRREARCDMLSLRWKNTTAKVTLLGAIYAHFRGEDFLAERIGLGRILSVEFIFTQSGAADYRLRVLLAFIPVGEAHLSVRNRPS